MTFRVCRFAPAAVLAATVLLLAGAAHPASAGPLLLRALAADDGPDGLEARGRFLDRRLRVASRFEQLHDGPRLGQSHRVAMLLPGPGPAWRTEVQADFAGTPGDDDADELTLGLRLGADDLALAFRVTRVIQPERDRLRHVLRSTFEQQRTGLAPDSLEFGATMTQLAAPGDGSGAGAAFVDTRVDGAAGWAFGRHESKLDLAADAAGPPAPRLGWEHRYANELADYGGGFAVSWQGDDDTTYNGSLEAAFMPDLPLVTRLAGKLTFERHEQAAATAHRADAELRGGLGGRADGVRPSAWRPFVEIAVGLAVEAGDESADDGLGWHGRIAGGWRF